MRMAGCTGVVCGTATLRVTPGRVRSELKEKLDHCIMAMAGSRHERRNPAWRIEHAVNGRLTARKKRPDACQITSLGRLQQFDRLRPVALHLTALPHAVVDEPSSRVNPIFIVTW